MASELFDDRLFEDARSVVLAKRAILAFLAVSLVLAMLSGYRAFFQVLSLELRSPEQVLRGGSIIEASVVTSGRTFVDVRIEMIQGAHSETLAARQAPKNDFASIDPRARRVALTAALTPEFLARFRAGPVRVRVTASGRSQWQRVPPAEVRELAAEIQHEPADGSRP